MTLRKSIITLFLLVLIISPLMTGCSTVKESTPVTIKVAILPVLDILPMLVAEAEGLYEKYGVTVEFVPVGSAPERDQVVASGQVNAMMNEILSVIFLNQEAVQVQAVRFARAATPEQGIFKILAAKDSGITSSGDLKGVPVAVGQGTVIEYLTDRILQGEGLTGDEIQVVAVPKIPDRMSLLASGEVEAATLPEPFVTLAVQQGATILLDDAKYHEYSHSVLTFRKDFIDEYPATVKNFLAAVEEAVLLINADPQKYASLMVEKQLVPAPLAENFKVPTYPLKGVPSLAQFEDALNWAIEKGYAAKVLPYEDCVTSAFLP